MNNAVDRAQGVPILDGVFKNLTVTASFTATNVTLIILSILSANWSITALGVANFVDVNVDSDLVVSGDSVFEGAADFQGDTEFTGGNWTIDTNGNADFTGVGTVQSFYDIEVTHEVQGPLLGSAWNINASGIGDAVFNDSVTALGFVRGASGLRSDTTVSIDGVTRVDQNAFYDATETQVVGEQRPAVANPAGGATVDAECRAQLIDLLDQLRAHGLIDT